MKFGHLLLRRISLLGAPQGHYVDYKALKRLIKSLKKDAKGNVNTSLFYERIKAELAKVNEIFIELISQSEAECDVIYQRCAKHHQAGGSSFEETAWAGLHELVKDMAPLSPRALECLDLKEARDCSSQLACEQGEYQELFFGLHRFCKSLDYIRTVVTLNSLAFRKILKKMDKAFGLSMQHLWLAFVRSQHFYSSLRFARLSSLADCLRALRDQSPERSLLGWHHFTCPVCTEPLQSPVALACSHRFCESCISQCAQVSKSCPVCRAEDVIRPDLPLDAVLISFFSRYLEPTPQQQAPCIPMQINENEVVKKVIKKKKHRELMSFVDLAQHCVKGSYVILDIDETIMVHEQYPCMLLTPQGTSLMNRAFEQQQQQLVSPKTTQYISQLYQKALYKRKLVEPETAEVILELQRRGVHVFGLTSRYASTATGTRKELQELGVDFTSSSPFPTTHLLTDPVTKAECRDGVIYTSAKNKGQALNRFLEGFIFQSLYQEAYSNGGVLPKDYAERVPHEIVFVDDRLGNLDSVSSELRAASNFRIPVTTYHYRRASYREVGETDNLSLPVFDAELLKAQLSSFLKYHIVLKDDQVQAILQRQRSADRARPASLAQQPTGLSPPAKINPMTGVSSQGPGLAPLVFE